ncbi:MAG TPA: glycosyltransferase family 39 protein [Bryobacteraceae bacterium]|nr:glycosyltransferase family 39 protein [Bryobacteraceae bacterium]
MRYELTVLLFAAAIFLSGVLSPPSLMDDVDSTQAQIARNMLQSGDWVTARLDGVAYLEKAPLKHWMTAVSFAIFGVRDWAARLPIALGAIALAWVVFRFGRWAFSEKAGYYAGLVTATMVGLFLFTRIVIPDVLMTLAVTLALWGLLRALDEKERNPRLWAWTIALSLAAGVLLKGLIGIVFPLGAGFFYLLFTRRLFARETWRRLHPFTGIVIFLAVALPWHVLATLRNPPYFDFTMHSGPGEYRGFFWFYFLNEHVLRFLNRRYPRDYNTVPRLSFWLFHLLWFFPWSAYLPSLVKLNYRPQDRAGRTRLMALCWIALVLLFFSLSTTQEYYSMPIYPAAALLLGCGMAGEGRLLRVGTRVVATVAGLAAAAAIAILILVRGVAAPGDISSALTQNPEAYTLSLGHMQDLTLQSFAYLRAPLALAAVAFLIGCIGGWRLKGGRAYLALAVMMLLFFQAARMALVVFDPYMSSRPLAEALRKSPRGKLILGDQYYTFSSIFFYTDYQALLLNGRVNNLEYGSYAPNAPRVFIDDAEFVRLWSGPERCYLAMEDVKTPRIEQLVGAENLHRVAVRGGKTLYTNTPESALAAAEHRTHAHLD